MPKHQADGGIKIRLGFYFKQPLEISENILQKPLKKSCCEKRSTPPRFPAAAVEKSENGGGCSFEGWEAPPPGFRASGAATDFEGGIGGYPVYLRPPTPLLIFVIDEGLGGALQFVAGNQPGAAMVLNTNATSQSFYVFFESV